MRYSFTWKKTFAMPVPLHDIYFNAFIFKVLRQIIKKENNYMFFNLK
jgi:hypothetical protein